MLIVWRRIYAIEPVQLLLNLFPHALKWIFARAPRPLRLALAGQFAALQVFPCGYTLAGVIRNYARGPLRPDLEPTSFLYKSLLYIATLALYIRWNGWPTRGRR